MARFRRFRRVYRNVRRFGVRSSARYAYRRGGGSLIFGGAGVVAGYAAPRIHALQDPAMVLCATLPGILPRSMSNIIPWQLRRFASGYVVGTMARAVVPNVLGISASSSNSDFI